MSSFRKITNQKPISGTRTSLQNGQTITSSGNPSLDHILGGGIPIGSLLLIEEDRYVTYSRVLVKYFLAEAVCVNHSIFLGCLDEDGPELMRKLPKPIEDNATTINNKQQQQQQQQQFNSDSMIDELNPKFDEMRIAWRYQNLPKINSEQTSTTTFGHNFNLLEQIDEETIKNIDVTYWNYNKDDDDDVENHKEDNKIFKNSKFYDFLQKLSNIIKSEKFSLQENNDFNTEKSILRVCIPSLGSPLWYDNNFTKNDFIKFLTILKSIIRSSNCVCFLTIPMHLMALLDENLPYRIRGIIDFVIELESFAGSDKETNPAFKEYNGILTIKKVKALNCLAIFMPETTDLAFKLRRKKFVIEKLHLPPELQESEQREQDDIVPSLSCGSSQKHLLEF